MVTRKTSVSLTEEALKAAIEAAQEAGVSVSAWLSQAAIDQSWHQHAIRVADELYHQAIEENGPLSPEDEKWIEDIVAATVEDRLPRTEIS
jgi:hypothetical protein